MLHAQDHAENIRVEGRGVAFRGLVGDRANLAFGAGVVHRDIEAAKPCDGLVDQSADVIVLAHVGVDELGLRTERAQLLNERLSGLITPAGNDDVGALLGEGEGGGAADAAESAGDQDNWVAHMLILADLLRLTSGAWLTERWQRFRYRRLVRCALLSKLK